MSETVPGFAPGSATDIQFDLQCGCVGVFVRGDSRRGRLTKPCTEHRKLDPIEQLKFVRSIEIQVQKGLPHAS